MGDIAKKWGWLTEAEIKDIIRKRRLGENLGDALVRLNLLSTVQLNILLYHQRKLQRPFGEFFVVVIQGWRRLAIPGIARVWFASDARRGTRSCIFIPRVSRNTADAVNPGSPGG
jgi:hypothetical protein